jgi:hypothetical protein
MNIVISIHIFPTELGKYARLVDDLNLAYLEIESDKHQVQVHTTLNLNNHLINWKESTLGKSTILAEYQNINGNIHTPHKYCETQTDNAFLGVNEHRRESIKRFGDVDSIIFLDSDVYFNTTIFKSHIDTYTMTKNLAEYFIITPQVVKLWDNTWDCIVNQKYLNESFDYHKTINPYEIATDNYGIVSVEKNDGFKWGGGWFNSISPKLLSLIDIPKSFVGYGPDDTYLMACSSVLKQHGRDIQQYILRNEVVAEGGIDQDDDTFSTIPMNDMREAFRYNGERLFYEEVQKFKAKL